MQKEFDNKKSTMLIRIKSIVLLVIYMCLLLCGCGENGEGMGAELRPSWIGVNYTKGIIGNGEQEIKVYLDGKKIDVVAKGEKRTYVKDLTYGKHELKIKHGAFDSKKIKFVVEKEPSPVFVEAYFGFQYSYNSVTHRGELKEGDYNLDHGSGENYIYLDSDYIKAEKFIILDVAEYLQYEDVSEIANAMSDKWGVQFDYSEDDIEDYLVYRNAEGTLAMAEEEEAGLENLHKEINLYSREGRMQFGVYGICGKMMMKTAEKKLEEKGAEKKEDGLYLTKDNMLIMLEEDEEERIFHILIITDGVEFLQSVMEDDSDTDDWDTNSDDNWGEYDTEEETSINEQEENLLPDSDKPSTDKKIDRKARNRLRNQYQEILPQFGEQCEMCEYAYYDMNNDGVEELILGYGSSEADFCNVIGALASDGTIINAGEFYSLCSLYGAEDGEGIYAVYGHMGEETVWSVKLQGEKIVVKELWQKNIGSGEYYSNDKPIKMTSYVKGSHPNVAAVQNVYILPDSQTHLISESDLAGLTKEECRIARNEIYARHGRIFADSELQSYFESKPWYYGYLSADEFDESVLNQIEKNNLDLITQYETKMGWR